MRFVSRPTLGFIWINFVHLFMVSLLPSATAWVARTRFASSPVAFYAGLFVGIDIAFNIFEREVLSAQGARTCPSASGVSLGVDHSSSIKMSARRPMINSISFSISVISFTRSSNIPTR